MYHIPYTPYHIPCTLLFAVPDPLMTVKRGSWRRSAPAKTLSPERFCLDRPLGLSQASWNLGTVASWSRNEAEMWVFMYIYIYVCVYTYIPTYIRTCMHTYICLSHIIYTYMDFYVYMYRYMYMSMSLSMYMSTYMSMSMPMSMSMCMYMQM